MPKKFWIADAIKHKGSLRKTLGARPGFNIPIGSLRKATGVGGKTGKRANLALTLRSFK